MASSDKKRNADEMNGSDNELLKEIASKNEEIIRMNNEREQVKQKHAVYETKKDTASESDGAWNEDEDEDSVCEAVQTEKWRLQGASKTPCSWHVDHEQAGCFQKQQVTAGSN